MNTRNYWEPFDIERKKVKTQKDHACFFTGNKIFKGNVVETHTMNVEIKNKKRSKVHVYMCGRCDECQHLIISRIG